MAVKLLFLLVFLIAVPSVAVIWRARRREARALAETPPEGRFIDIDGVRIHAVVMGAGPDLVLIHGASGNTRDMTYSLAPKLAARYRVIAFDRPGLGHSDRIGEGGATLAEQADILVRAARELGATRPVVMGQSYGGAVALAWAVRHPHSIAALVPVAAASNPWKGPLGLYYQVISSRVGNALLVPLITAFVPGGIVRRVVDSIFAPQRAPADYAARSGPGLTLRRAATRENARQLNNLKAEVDALHQRYGEITVPTEIIHGTADTTVDLGVHSEPLARQIPGAVLTRLNGIGHMPHHVAEDAVIAAIDRAAARAGLR